MTIVKHPVALVVVFTWLGLVVGVAFLASWLKYSGFGVTLPVGLGIDRKLLPALLRVEWAFAIALLADLFFGKASATTFLLAAAPVLLLVLQSIWLEPAMEAQALLVFHGQGDLGAGLRTTNTAIEAVKVSALAVLGLWQFKRTTTRAGDTAPNQPNTRS